MVPRLGAEVANDSFVLTTPDRTVLKIVSDMAGEGIIVPQVGAILPLAKAREAHLLMDEGKVEGKIVLEVR